MTSWGRSGGGEGPFEERLVGCGGLGADSGGRWGLAGQPAPLAGADPVVGVSRHEFDRRGLDHAVVFAHHAAFDALLVFDHDSPLEHGAHANLLAVDHCAETAADFVIEGWDDAGQRNEINDLAHKVASLGLGGLSCAAEIKNCRTMFGSLRVYQTVSRGLPEIAASCDGNPERGRLS